MRIDGRCDGTRGPDWWARLLSFGAGAGALLGFFGPFGSYVHGDHLILTLHWMLMTTLGAGLLGLTVPRLIALGVRQRLPRRFALGGALIVVAVPLAAIASLEASWLWPRQTAELGPADWYTQTLAVSATLMAVWVLLDRVRGRSSTEPTTPAASSFAAKSFSAVTPALCLQMEDHYVRVHRPSGSSLELMPLQDAIERFGGEGLQVHRSWWVATEAVSGPERDGRNWRLRLTNGLTVPVARNRIGAARAMGLIG